MTFDIAEDELQIFLAETDEHLQMLDEGLVRLEREGDDSALLQEIFRAAHTLKGSAGVIGHQRMAEVTHAMETVLDGVRKHTIAVSPSLVDACLESLDALKLLRNEVVKGESGDMDITSYVDRLLALNANMAGGNGASRADPHQMKSNKHRRPESSRQRAAAVGRKGKTAQASARSARGRNGRAANGGWRTAEALNEEFVIQADIAQDSVASAARAFQMLLALQSLGAVRDLNPSQSVIETAVPVPRLTARLITTRSREEIRKALADVSEIERLVIGGEEIDLTPPPAPDPAALPSETPRLGEFLVEKGYLTRSQLEEAIRQQATEPPPFQMLGQTLVKMGLLTQQILDQAVAQHIQLLRPAQPQPVGSPTAERAKVRAADKTIRTSVERLDSLMNLVGELITDRNRLNQIRSDLAQRRRGDDHVESLAQTVMHVGRITDQLQEEVMRIRMLPIANAFNKLPRLVRDLARKAGKQVELTIRGEETELDRTVIEEIGDPLIHLLRNAVDHGIEPPAARAAAGKAEHGTILLTARHEESHIIVTVEDDGGGIDAARVKAAAVQKGILTEAEAAALSVEEAVDLIFKPGFSTAKEVSDVSGRGVGMDIVRANIERLNGSVLVETWPGRGTRFQIVLPLTLAIVPSLMVGVGARTFAIPLASVMETLRIPAGDIHTIRGKPAIQLRGHVLPLLPLGRALAFDAGNHTKQHEYVVAVRWGKVDMGLMVDVLLGNQEMVIKPLGPMIGDAPGISGAAILGDGRVALIVDVPGLFRLAGA